MARGAIYAALNTGWCPAFPEKVLRLVNLIHMAQSYFPDRGVLASEGQGWFCDCAAFEEQPLQR